MGLLSPDLLAKLTAFPGMAAFLQKLGGGMGGGGGVIGQSGLGNSWWGSMGGRGRPIMPGPGQQGGYTGGYPIGGGGGGGGMFGGGPIHPPAPAPYGMPPGGGSGQGQPPPASTPTAMSTPSPYAPQAPPSAYQTPAPPTPLGLPGVTPNAFGVPTQTVAGVKYYLNGAGNWIPLGF